MKKELIVLLVLVAMIFVVSCSKKESLNVVTGIKPVRAAIAEHIAMLDDLRNVKPEERAAFIKENWPNLSNDIVANLSRRGIIKSGDKVKSIAYSYGSAESVTGEDKGGIHHKGKFSDELIATVTTEKLKDPIVLAVRCSNGLFDLKGKFASIFNELPVTEFTIGKGESLCNYVSYDTAIDLAEKHNLSLFRGKNMKPVGVAEARTLSDRTDYIQVTVRVYPGDHFDLIAGTYVPARP